MGGIREPLGLRMMKSQKKEPIHEKNNYYHSTCIQAAQTAQRDHVKKLLLTHISARYVGPMVKKLQADAREIFPNTRVVRDFDTYNVPFPERREK